MGMKGIDGDSVIGIGIIPVMLHRSVVHGQQLNHSHVIGSRPIHK